MNIYARITKIASNDANYLTELHITHGIYMKTRKLWGNLSIVYIKLSQKNSVQSEAS